MDTEGRGSQPCILVTGREYLPLMQKALELAEDAMQRIPKLEPPDKSQDDLLSKIGDLTHALRIHHNSLMTLMATVADQGRVQTQILASMGEICGMLETRVCPLCKGPLRHCRDERGPFVVCERCGIYPPEQKKPNV